MADLYGPRAATSIRADVQAIGSARATVAQHIINQWRQNPDWSRDQVTQMLYDLLDALGLLPDQNPEQMMTKCGPSNAWNDGGLDKPVTRPRS